MPPADNLRSRGASGRNRSPLRPEKYDCDCRPCSPHRVRTRTTLIKGFLTSTTSIFTMVLSADRRFNFLSDSLSQQRHTPLRLPGSAPAAQQATATHTTASGKSPIFPTSCEATAVRNFPLSGARGPNVSLETQLRPPADAAAALCCEPMPPPKRRPSALCAREHALVKTSTLTIRHARSPAVACALTLNTRRWAFNVGTHPAAFFLGWLPSMARFAPTSWSWSQAGFRCIGLRVRHADIGWVHPVRG